VLDDKVVSAPEIQSVINGSTSVTGQFNQQSATELADVLKFGALPLSFIQLNAVTISPSLGTDQLEAGLLAGGIGLVPGGALLDDLLPGARPGHHRQPRRLRPG